MSDLSHVSDREPYLEIRFGTWSFDSDLSSNNGEKEELDGQPRGEPEVTNESELKEQAA